MSRRKSAPAARTRAARPAAASRGVYVTQPRSDVYVAMLGIALGAILIGCLLLVLVWGRYDYQTTAQARPTLAPTAASPAATALAALPAPTPSIFV